MPSLCGDTQKYISTPLNSSHSTASEGEQTCLSIATTTPAYLLWPLSCGLRQALHSLWENVDEVGAGRSLPTVGCPAHSSEVWWCGRGTAVILVIRTSVAGAHRSAISLVNSHCCRRGGDCGSTNACGWLWAVVVRNPSPDIL